MNVQAEHETEHDTGDFQKDHHPPGAVLEFIAILIHRGIHDQF